MSSMVQYKLFAVRNTRIYLLFAILHKESRLVVTTEIKQKDLPSEGNNIWQHWQYLFGKFLLSLDISDVICENPAY